MPDEPVHMPISPRGWGLVEADDDWNPPPMGRLGLDADDLRERARNNTQHWLKREFNGEIGAFHGYYDAPNHALTDPQTVNIIAPFQCLAGYDRFGDDELLDMGRRAADWLNDHMVETHPMSLVLGGVKDNIKPNQLWTKYTSDYVTLNLGLWERLQEQVYLDRAIQSSRYLLQSQNHKYAPKYDEWHERWLPRGWQSFGRVLVAMLALREFTGDDVWLERAHDWAEYSLRLQAENGCFYLINETYYSSDIAADEIRGLIRMARRTDDDRFLDAALRFADWHVERQDPDGGWPLSEDRWGEAVTNYKGPGDMPNIAIAQLLVHKVTGEIKYLASAVRALRYTLGHQQLPDDENAPYFEDENTHWGFWSWDPAYDFTMSADQSTHHCRGYWFFVDYMHSLGDETLDEIGDELVEMAAAD